MGTSLRRPWEETPAEFAKLAKRLDRAVADVNATCDVRGLCREFPQRLADLVAQGGDRLKQ